MSACTVCAQWDNKSHTLLLCGHYEGCPKISIADQLCHLPPSHPNICCDCGMVEVLDSNIFCIACRPRWDKKEPI